MQNKLHFFGNYEYERQPLTSIWNTPYPAFNVELSGIRRREAGWRARRLAALVEARA